MRIARLALAEKGIDYELVPVDIFDREGIPDWYLEHHPFKRIPAFGHGQLRLFETSAIARYIDEAFEGPKLQPGDAAGRAAMNQIIGLLDAYAYRAMVWGVYVERVGKAQRGETPDEALIAQSMAVAETCLSTLSRLKGSSPWLAGDELTLADIYAAPIFAYFIQADEGRELLGRHPSLCAWWQEMRARPGFDSTRPTGS